MKASWLFHVVRRSADSDGSRHYLFLKPLRDLQGCRQSFLSFVGVR